MTVLHLNSQAQAGPCPPLVPQPGLFSVPEAHRVRLVEQSREIWRRCAVTVQQGIDDGSCRACDATTIAHISAGAFLWLHKWLPEDYPMSSLELANTQTRIFSNGLSR